MFNVVAIDVQQLEVGEVLQTLDPGEVVVGQIEFFESQQLVEALHLLDHVVTQVQHLQLAQAIQVLNVLQ